MDVRNGKTFFQSDGQIVEIDAPSAVALSAKEMQVLNFYLPIDITLHSITLTNFFLIDTSVNEASNAGYYYTITHQVACHRVKTEQARLSMPSSISKFR